MHNRREGKTWKNGKNMVGGHTYGKTKMFNEYICCRGKRRSGRVLGAIYEEE